MGGIESVTLSDEEARRRGTQKTVLERRAPPTFEVLIEIQERNLLNLHQDVALAVDSLLRGRPLSTETRRREADGKITVEKPKQAAQKSNGRKRRKNDQENPQGGYTFRAGGNSSICLVELSGSVVGRPRVYRWYSKKAFSSKPAGAPAMANSATARPFARYTG